MLHFLASIILSTAGWSAGAASAAGRRLPVPFAFDVVGIPLLWIVLLAPGWGLGRAPAAAAALLSGFALGVVSGLAGRRSYPAAKRASVSGAGRPSCRIRGAWRGFASRMGGFQGRFMLAVFYFLMLTPVGLVVRRFSDPLRTGRVESGWSARPSCPGSAEECRRQF